MKHTALLSRSGDRRHRRDHGRHGPGRRKWWPAKYYDLDSGSPKVEEYTPLEKA